MKPYKEKKIDFNEYIREFNKETLSEELVWHRDKEDRIIEPIGETNWLIQIDDQLPTLISKRVFIPKEVWHRLIKGDGDLKIKLTKLT